MKRILLRRFSCIKLFLSDSYWCKRWKIAKILLKSTAKNKNSRKKHERPSLQILKALYILFYTLILLYSIICNYMLCELFVVIFSWNKIWAGNFKPCKRLAQLRQRNWRFRKTKDGNAGPRGIYDQGLLIFINSR